LKSAQAVAVTVEETAGRAVMAAVAGGEMAGDLADHAGTTAGRVLIFEEARVLVPVDRAVMGRRVGNAAMDRRVRRLVVRIADRVPEGIIVGRVLPVAGTTAGRGRNFVEAPAVIAVRAGRRGVESAGILVAADAVGKVDVLTGTAVTTAARDRRRRWRGGRRSWCRSRAAWKPSRGRSRHRAVRSRYLM
jgi:hypothetical protein